MHVADNRRLDLYLYLSRMEFERRFAGTAGGKLWMFVGPLMTIVVISLVTQFGLRASFHSHHSVALAVALCAWLFFSEAVNSSVSSITGNPHLVKKVVFPVMLLPLSTVATALVVHLLILGAVIAFAFFAGEPSFWSLLQMPLWVILLFVFASSFGVLSASLNVLFRDVSAIVPNTVALLFWLTPIIWQLDMVPDVWRPVVLINPLAVMINGYQNALLGTPSQLGEAGLAIFLLVNFLFCAGSFLVFRVTRPHFANVL